MSSERRPFSPQFTIDVTSDASAPMAGGQIDANELIVGLLRQMLEGQKREIQLLEEISAHISGPQKQRVQELNAWKESHPELAKECRQATELLGKVQQEFLHKLTAEIADSDETLIDSDFMLNEFVDRFGPRLAHLNGVIQVLSQLSSSPNAPAASSD